MPTGDVLDDRASLSAARDESHLTVVSPEIALGLNVRHLIADPDGHIDAPSVLRCPLAPPRDKQDAALCCCSRCALRGIQRTGPTSVTIGVLTWSEQLPSGRDKGAPRLLRGAKGSHQRKKLAPVLPTEKFVTCFHIE